MSSDSFKFDFFRLISFGFSKTDTEIKLNEGETIILRHWSWRKFGHIRKAYTLKDGKVTMQRLI